MDEEIPDGAGLAAAWPEGAETRPAGRRPRSVNGRIEAEARRRIGLNLRVLYAGILAQPIPERFEALVAALAAGAEEESPR